MVLPLGSLMVLSLSIKWDNLLFPVGQVEAGMRMANPDLSKTKRVLRE